MSWTEEYQVNGKTHYRVRYWENGKKKSRTAGPNKVTLKALVKQVEHRVILNIPSPLSTAHCVREYLNVLGKTLRPRTQEIARTSLEPLLNEYGKSFVHDIKTQDIERIKNTLLAVRKANGINIVIRNIKSFFSYCLRMGYVSSTPAQVIKQFKVTPVARFLTRQEMVNLYRHASKRLRRAIYVIYNIGLRRGEYLGIRREDIGGDFVKVTGKTGIRKVPLRPMVKKLLIRDCGKWEVDAMENAFRRAVKGSGLGRIRIHDLRHTFASAYLKSGGTLADLRLIGGWKNLGVLQMYAHFQEDYLAERMVKVRL